jgi:uncharacterized protein
VLLWFWARIEYSPIGMRQNTPLPFEPISKRYAMRFGCRVQKIPVTIAGTCPNREGFKGMETCVFCDEWGSAAYPEQKQMGLAEQIESKRGLLGDRYRSQAFLVYFQAYTSSFLAVTRLRSHFETALSYPEVKGLVLGTRPDCVPPALITLMKEYSKKTFVSIELGVQSFFEKPLRFLRRGHGPEATFDAIKRITACPEIDVGLHLIFGLPEETDADIRETARIVASLGVHHVKLHNLHVLKGTALETLHSKGAFEPLELEDYADRVSLFLQYLPKTVAVQRLAAVSSRWEELVAPDWTRYKMKSHQFIIDRMQLAGAYQGQLAPAGCYLP